MAVQAAARPTLPGRALSPVREHVAETPRLETILLATDGTSASDAATEQAIMLAASLEARLLVVSVVPPGSRSQGWAASGGHAVRDERVMAAQGIVERARAAGAVATFLVWEGEPGESIVAAAEAENADVIVVGTHGRSAVGRILIGSVSDFVVRHARCPVLVVRPHSEPSAH